jgi:hypothetical protein
VLSSIIPRNFTLFVSNKFLLLYFIISVLVQSRLAENFKQHVLS